MLTALCFTVFGYLLGSILFARVYGALFGKDLISNSTDGNPGTSNAFIYGGMLCGTLTLLGDLIKGFLPVFLYLYIILNLITSLTFNLNSTGITVMFLIKVLESYLSSPL